MTIIVQLVKTSKLPNKFLVNARRKEGLRLCLSWTLSESIFLDYNKITQESKMGSCTIVLARVELKSDQETLWGCVYSLAPSRLLLLRVAGPAAEGSQVTPAGWPTGTEAEAPGSLTFLW